MDHRSDPAAYQAAPDSPGPQPVADLPASSPLDMPVRPLSDWTDRVKSVVTAPDDIARRRLIMVAATLLAAGLSWSATYQTVALGGLTRLEVICLTLLAPLFLALSLWFCTAVAGFAILLGRPRDPLEIDGEAPLPRLAQKTAILMPIHNEDPAAVFARLRAMDASLSELGAAHAFDIFILSDTRQDAIALAEQSHYARFRREAGCAVYYRLRADNTGRKAGNVADWVRRYGGSYESMIILDADSLMTGDAMIRLADAMERHPGVGLIQSMPTIINGQTVFARCLQFATRLYGRVAWTGLAWWSGSESSFWGHNAIVRTRAFADCCGLPSLPGEPPFGGPIQSHDMVEAALLRRRGWAVHMVMIDGSYEEFPPTILDHAIRDRRWAQGNLQHLRLLDATGFHWASRLHLLIGASAYLTAPAWLLLILVQIGQALLGQRDLLTYGPPLHVLIVTLLCLFGGKAMGLTWVLADAQRRAAFGGAFRVLRSGLVEMLLAILMAPVAMVNQTKALIGLLLGIPSHWTVQSRETDGMTVREVLPKTREHLLLGAALLAVGIVDPILGAWLSPVIAGLLTAPWLIALTSSRRLGDRALASGLFQVPPPAIADE